MKLAIFTPALMRKIKEEINMRIFGLPLGTIGKIATGVGNVLSFAAMIVVPMLSKKDVVSDVEYSVVTTYDDVVMAIINSSMLSKDMTRAIAILPMDGTSTIYKAIINVIDSNMLSGDKVETIKHICKE